VKTRGLDCGFNFQKNQGPKREEKDLIVNTFELQVDRGLIPRKGEGSLAKRQGRSGKICSGPLDPDRATEIKLLKRRGICGSGRLDLDLTARAKRYAGSDLIRWSRIGRPGPKGEGNRGRRRLLLAGAAFPRWGLTGLGQIRSFGGRFDPGLGLRWTTRHAQSSRGINWAWRPSGQRERWQRRVCAAEAAGDARASAVLAPEP
jgi:hypothetical protein